MEENHFFSLPKELLAIIFNIVGAEDLLRLESTNKLWKKLSWDSLTAIKIGPRVKSTSLNDETLMKLFNKVTPQKIRNMNFTGEKAITTSLLALEKFPNIHCFSCRSLKSTVIKSIAPLLTAVRKLDLSSRELTDECIKIFAHNMPHLTKLLLSNSSELKELPDLTRLTKLQTLNLAFSEKINEHGMDQICQLTQLERLDLCWLKRIVGEDFEKVAKLTNLIHLDISNIDSVRDVYMTALLALTKLELLDLSYYKIFSDVGMSVLGQLPNMTRLIFVDNRKVTSNGMNYLSSLAKLNMLSLSTMPNITNDHFFSTLYNLTLLRVKMRQENFSVLTNLTSMRDLSISAVNDITEEFFEYVAMMADLQSLTLRASQCSIAVDTLTVCTNLTNLEIDDCMAFTRPNFDTDIVDRLLNMTTLKQLQLRYDRDFNRLAELTNLETLVIEVPPSATVRKDDFTMLLTLPRLGSLHLTAPVPQADLKAVFGQHKQLTNLMVESNQSETEELRQLRCASLVPEKEMDSAKDYIQRFHGLS